MAKYFRSGDSKTLHIVVPGPWKEFIQRRAAQNHRSLSDEARNALGLMYDLKDTPREQEIIEPELVRKLELAGQR